MSLQQTGHLLRRQERLSVKQYDVASYAELGLASLEIVYATDSIIERHRGRHERRGSDDSPLTAFYDGTIDARGHSEVVGVHDKSAHGFSVAGKKTGPC